MMKRLLSSALCAGFAAGLFAAVLQFAFVQPVLLTAELYETGALVRPLPDAAAATDPAMADGGMSMAAPATADTATGDTATGAAPSGTAPAAPVARPLDEPARLGMTVLFMALTYAGYGALLVAAMALAETRGRGTPTLRQGVVWGIAGFAALQLAPAFGLAPGLPGMLSAEVVPRQLWWGLTAVCTAAGLGLIGFGRGPAAVLGGAALVALPQIIGAPQPEVYSGAVPAELAARFTARVLGAALASWALLGALAAWFLRMPAAR